MGSHDNVLVVLSIFIAVAASYTALDLAARVKAAPTRLGAISWLVTAAVCMGGGIWSMHFVAMLAYVMPGVQASYNLWLTALSLITAIVVTGGGFAVVSRRKTGTAGLLLGGLLMGGGIVAMHYMGMAAMRIHGALTYNAVWVAISIFIAIGAAIAALWCAFRRVGAIGKPLAACLMGIAISGMHFAGMHAASFEVHIAVDQAHGYASVEQSALALAIAATTFLILVAAVIASMFDRRFADLVEKEALKLKKSEEQFRALYRRTPLPLHALDEKGRIEEVSDAWLSLIGYSREEIVGRPLINFMTEESARRRIQSEWPQLLANGEFTASEYKFVSKDGRFLDVLSTSRVERDAQGNFIWAIGGLTDLTARKQTEEALRQAQKVEAIGQLTGGIAHDFNNLLAVVLGNLDMLKKRLPADERLSRLTDNAIEGAKRGAALTQRMLSFARRQSLSPQAIDLSLLVKGMEDLLKKSLGPQMDVRMMFPLALPKVHADPHQLEMAILNLAVNARDAMGGEGPVSIEAVRSSHSPDGLKSGEYICLKVTDEGPGMDEDTQARAVEPFFTTKGVGKGTGLGLSMVNGFVDQSGGRMVIDSHLGKGTTIELWLPVAQEHSVAEPQVVTSPIEPNWKSLLIGKTVLAVDDDALVLMNTEALLEELGARVLTASSGFQALELLQKQPAISCVVTDYAMPGMTGSQLAEAIRVSNPNLPIIIATGYAEVPGEVAGYLKLTKPFSEKDLAKVIVQACPPAPSTVIAIDSRR